MPTIDELLVLLQDNKWHNLTELTQHVALSSDKLEKVVNFLTEYGFVQLDKNPQKVKIEPKLLTLLTEIRRLEQETLQ